MLRLIAMNGRCAAARDIALRRPGLVLSTNIAPPAYLGGLALSGNNVLEYHHCSVIHTHRIAHDGQYLQTGINGSP